MASIFSKIVSGEIPCYKIAETKEFMAFLDIFPLVKGHALVIPKQEINRLFDLDDESYADLMLFSKRIAAAIRRTFPCDRVGMTVIGLEVPHAHIHLIPINKMSDMDFTREKLSLSKEEFESIALRIRGNLNTQ